MKGIKNNFKTADKLQFKFPIYFYFINILYICSLGNFRLENLIRILEEGPSVDEYDVTSAIELWASSQSRRLNQYPRKQYAKRQKKRKIESLDSSSSSSEGSESIDLDLDECERFIRS